MPSTSLIWGVGAVLSALSSPAAANKYELEDSYNGKNWLDAFKFETYDKNNGYVQYVDETTAKSMSLYKVDGNDVVFGVDTTETLYWGAQYGRKSVRLEGKKNYNHGLFILDVKSMPAACGLWPAFWTLGAEEPWPLGGEIDIVEGVNNQANNKMVLHTSPTCVVNGLGGSGTPVNYDCANSPNNAGCDVIDARAGSFGQGFNKADGGLYAMEWTSDAIKVWFFPRGSNIPSAVTAKEPDTSKFGTPAASYQGNCDIDERFKDHRFIFTNNFCGDWAGPAYANSGCPMYKHPDTGVALDGWDSCKRHVAEHPEIFVGNNNWRISSFKTFQQKKIVSSSSVRRSSSTRAPSSTRTRVTIRASSTSVRSSSSVVRSSSVRPSSTRVSSSSAHVTSSAQVSSSVHVSSSSSEYHVSSSSSDYHVSSSSSEYHGSSQSVAVSSSEYPASTPAGSSVYPTSSDVVYPSGSDVYPSGSVVYPSGSDVYPSGSASSTPCTTTGGAYATKTPEGDKYGDKTPEGEKYGEKTPDAASSTPCTTSTAHYSVKTPDAGEKYDEKTPEGEKYGEKTPEGEKYGEKTPDAASSTPCTTSSAKPAKETKDYPDHPDHTKVYSEDKYPTNAKPTQDYPVYSDYPNLPSFSIAKDYPAVTSAPVYGEGYKSGPEASKTTLTTTITTTYVDVCETGYTTITTTHTATYYPTTTPAPKPGKPEAEYPSYPPVGFEVTTKVCNYGCGSGPKTVTVTIPCTQCYGAPTTSTVYSTKYVTVKSETDSYPVASPVPYAPVPEQEYPHGPLESVKYPVSGKPQPSAGYGYPAVNGTKPYYSTGAYVKPTASVTGPKTPEFTGAASSFKVGGVVVAAGIAALFL